MKTLTTKAKSRLCADHFNFHQALQVEGSDKRMTRATVDGKALYFLETIRAGFMIESKSFRSFSKMMREA